MSEIIKPPEILKRKTPMAVVFGTHGIGAGSEETFYRTMNRYDEVLSQNLARHKTGVGLVFVERGNLGQTAAAEMEYKHTLGYLPSECDLIAKFSVVHHRVPQDDNREDQEELKRIRNCVKVEEDKIELGLLDRHFQSHRIRVIYEQTYDNASGSYEHGVEYYLNTSIRDARWGDMRRSLLNFKTGVINSVRKHRVREDKIAEKIDRFAQAEDVTFVSGLVGRNHVRLRRLLIGKGYEDNGVVINGPDTRIGYGRAVRHQLLYGDRLPLTDAQWHRLLLQHIYWDNYFQEAIIENKVSGKQIDYYEIESKVQARVNEELLENTRAQNFAYPYGNNDLGFVRITDRKK